MWEKSEPEKARKTILMPPNKFVGPVGGFSELVYQCYKKIPFQRYCLWPLMVEALDRHYFDMGHDKSFLCPLSGCAAYFSQAREWTVHAAEAHYQEWMKLLEVLPSSSVGDDLRDRNQALDRKTREVQDQFKEMKNAWSTGNETRRREIQHSWMEQLNSDAAWQTKEKGEKNMLWLEFMQYMQSE
jgi:hypothetical protein